VILLDFPYGEEDAEDKAELEKFLTEAKMFKNLQTCKGFSIRQCWQQQI